MVLSEGKCTPNKSDEIILYGTAYSGCRLEI